MVVLSTQQRLRLKKQQHLKNGEKFEFTPEQSHEIVNNTPEGQRLSQEKNMRLGRGSWCAPSRRQYLEFCNELKRCQNSTKIKSITIIKADLAFRAKRENIAHLKVLIKRVHFSSVV